MYQQMIKALELKAKQSEQEPSEDKGTSNNNTE
jgi:hypothetical protein